jgi:hypothetical protein
MARFSLTDQVERERPTFELEDGTELDFRLRSDLGAADIARMQKCSKIISQLSARLQKNPDDVRLAEKYNELYGDFVLILLPDLPAEVLAKLPTGARIEVVNFWTAEQKKLDGRDPLDFLLR